MKDSTILNHSIILKLYDKEEVQKLSFLEEQQQTLEIYLTNKYSRQIKMINYVLSNYDSLLQDLTSRNPKIISKKLSEVNYRINPYKNEPTKFDYAFEYHQFELKEQVDELLKRIQESLTFPAIDISKLL